MRICYYFTIRAVNSVAHILSNLILFAFVVYAFKLPTKNQSPIPKSAKFAQLSHSHSYSSWWYWLRVALQVVSSSQKKCELFVLCVLDRTVMWCELIEFFQKSCAIILPRTCIVCVVDDFLDCCAVLCAPPAIWVGEHKKHFAGETFVL